MEVAALLLSRFMKKCCSNNCSQKATVHSFGRFCELGDNADEVMALPETTKIKLNDRQYLVMENYQHFSVGGNVAGGNTDEMMW